MSEVAGVTKDNAGGFADWWGTDETQEKFQGLMGVFGALGAGLAGLPMGGTDTSSLERASRNMMEAPGKAREMFQQRRFTSFIESELETEEDPYRKTMLQGALANPAQAAQYLSMESPEAVEGRGVRLAQLRHDLGMERVEAEIQGRKDVAGIKQGPSPSLMNSIHSANAWYDSQSKEDQRKIREGGFSQGMVDPGMTQLIPFLYSPHGGVLHQLGLEPDFVAEVSEGNLKKEEPGWLSDIHYGVQSQEDQRAAVGEAVTDVQKYVSDFWEFVTLDNSKGSDSEARETVGSAMFAQ
jgi:hypothetical protein